MTQIVHVIYRDKFTDGYIKFMNEYLSGYRHLFYTTKEGFDVDLTSNDNVIFLDSFNDLHKRENKKNLMDADLIVISGFFFFKEMRAFYNRKILKKTYFHLWGADLYCLKENETVNMRLGNLLRKYFFVNAGGIINLIPGDYEILCKYCTPKGKHFVAPMCSGGVIPKIISELRTCEKRTNPYRILVGNSATPSNQHLEILQTLERFKNEQIEIVCPLSYGNADYAKTVIDFGKKLFGSKFVPLTDYMDKTAYYRTIAESSVAIFNNDRQQAMGNINASLGLGCKVFLRTDTPMWEIYHQERKYVIYKVEDIAQMSFEEFLKNDTDPQYNWEQYRKSTDLESSVQKWKNVFNSIEERK